MKNTTNNRASRQTKTRTLSLFNGMKPLMCVILCCLAVSNLFSQASVEKATIKGSVTDQNGSVLPNATVQIIDLAKGTKRAVETNETGDYQISLIQAGAYDLEISAKGFENATIKNLQLSVGQIAVRDIHLIVRHQIEAV